MQVFIWSALGVMWVVAMIAWLGQGFGTSRLLEELKLQYGPRTGRNVLIGLIVLTVIAIVGLRLM